MVEGAGDTDGLAGGPGNKHDHSLASLMGSIRLGSTVVAFQSMVYVVSQIIKFSFSERVKGHLREGV